MRKPIKKCIYFFIDIDDNIYIEDSSLYKINKQIEFIDNSLTNFDYLSNVEKFKFLSILYSFDVSYKDLLELVNYKYNKLFDKIESLSTDMEEDFSVGGTIDKYGIVLDCAVTYEFVPEKRRYSYEEIISLIDDGIIYPLVARSVFRHSNFDEDEFGFHSYYDPEENDGMVDIILKDKKIRIFVPDDIKLFRDSGYVMFNIDENNFDEDSASLLWELYSQYLTKNEIFNTVKEYILQSLVFLDNASCYNTNAENVASKVRKYYNNTFLK